MKYVDPSEVQRVREWVSKRLLPLLGSEVGPTEHLSGYVMLLIEIDNGNISNSDMAILLREKLHEFLEEDTDSFVSELCEMTKSWHEPRDPLPQVQVTRSESEWQDNGNTQNELIEEEEIEGTDLYESRNSVNEYEIDDYERGRGLRSRRRRASKSPSPVQNSNLPSSAAVEVKRVRTASVEYESRNEERRDLQGGGRNQDIWSREDPMRGREGRGRPGRPNQERIRRGYGPRDEMWDQHGQYPPRGYPMNPLYGPPRGPQQGGRRGYNMPMYGYGPPPSAGYGPPPMARGYSAPGAPHRPPFISPGVPPSSGPLVVMGPQGPVHVDLESLPKIPQDQAGGIMIPLPMNSIVPVNSNFGPAIPKTQPQGGANSAWGGLGVRKSTAAMPNSNKPVMHKRTQESSTLRLVGIPVSISEESLSNHFKRFGIVVATRLQPLPPSDDSGGARYTEALVQMSDVAQAKNALVSPKAVLDNRFIRVYQHGENILDPDAAEVQEIIRAAEAVVSNREALQEKGAKQVAKTAEVLKAQKQKAAAISNQTLIQKKISRASEKLSLYKILREQLGEAGHVDEIKDAEEKIAIVEKELVELKDAENSNTATVLEATNQLLQMESEARELGAMIPPYSGGPATHAGRGKEGLGPRVRGGRGGSIGAKQGGGRSASIARRTLDLRTTCLLVKGLPPDTEEAILKMQFAGSGVVSGMQHCDVHNPDGSLSYLVQFVDRRSAEAARARVREFRGVPLTITWYEGKINPLGN